ncbi:hypothetical protein V1525DRAFT_408653 [Lipomyces kononenkoae]|uniref:Uncharacterized protein n=1 Tax=Lipomyces kononenkoae TaxID=34357 RepID=A0ACC3SW12_LIPKO
MSAFHKWYNARLAARPLLTNCVTTAFLFGTGDAVAQTLSPDPALNGRYDYVRTARMCFHGGVVFAPVVSQWYKLISSRIVIPGRPMLEALARMTVDQTVWAPFGLASFYVSMGVLQLHSWDQIKEELRTKWWRTMIGNYAVWPAVQFVNFRLIPLDYRLMFVNIISIGWNAFLSWFSATNIEQSMESIEKAEHRLEELEAKLEKRR